MIQIDNELLKLTALYSFKVPAPPSLIVGRGGFGAGGKSESGGSKDDDFTDDEGDETDSGGSGAADKKKIHVFQKKASTSRSSSTDLSQVTKVGGG